MWQIGQNERITGIVDKMVQMAKDNPEKVRVYTVYV